MNSHGSEALATGSQPSVWLDPTSGLENNLNRWLDPAVGRWISEDPIGFAAGDANVYRYVGNRVTRFTDTSGLFGGGSDSSFDRYADAMRDLRERERDRRTQQEEQKKKKTDRDRLLESADKVGLGDEVREVLEIADKHHKSIFDGIRDWTQGWFLPISGECGLWTWDVAQDLEGTNADKNERIRLDTVNIRQNDDPGHEQNQNCIRLCFINEDGEIERWYLDDGDVGGDDRVFDDDLRIDYQGNGKGNGLIVGTTGLLDNPPLQP